MEPRAEYPRVMAYGSAQSEDGSNAGEHFIGDIRANAMLESDRYELTATITNQALTIHVHDKLTKQTAINVTLA